MEQMDRAALEALVRSIVMEKLGSLSCPVKKLSVPQLDVTEEHRMDTGNPADRGSYGGYLQRREPCGSASILFGA